MPQDKPTIALNLDKLEAENVTEPYPVVLGGKRYVLIDARDLDFRELIEAQVAFMNGNPMKALETMVETKDQEAFFANKLPLFKLKKMIKGYNDHFGIDPGEAPASPPS